MSVDLAWTALDWPGMEHVVVSDDGGGFRADGQVVQADGDLASIRYQLRCTADWRVTSVAIQVANAVSGKTLDLAASGDGHWRVDGRPAPELAGCTDVDISCTPLTNTLPIRRLSWSPGQARDLQVVYVRVPSLEVHPAWQRYTLLDRGRDRHEALFRYESGEFSADLRVDPDGFVTDYPGLWRRVEPLRASAG